MEPIKMLEQRVSGMLALIKDLKEHNEQLSQDNNELRAKVKELESSYMTDQKVMQDEQEMTKLAVDDLIKSIDSLVSSENH